MSTMDIIALVIISAHSIYVGLNPPKEKPNRSFIAGFLLTFLGDAIVYFIITFSIGYIFAVRSASSLFGLLGH